MRSDLYFDVTWLWLTLNNRQSTNKILITEKLIINIPHHRHRIQRKISFINSSVNLWQKKFFSIFLYYSPFFEGKIEKIENVWIKSLHMVKIPAHCENSYTLWKYLHIVKIPSHFENPTHCENSYTLWKLLHIVKIPTQCENFYTLWKSLQKSL